MQKYANFFCFKVAFDFVDGSGFRFFDVGHLPHEVDIIHRIAIFVDSEFEEVDHGIEPTLFDVWIFAEIIIGVEQVARV